MGQATVRAGQQEGAEGNQSVVGGSQREMGSGRDGVLPAV